MTDSYTQESLVSELEAVKQIRVGMGRFLELMQFVREDLQTMAENLETLEALNNDWCHVIQEGKENIQEGKENSDTTPT